MYKYHVCDTNEAASWNIGRVKEVVNCMYFDFPVRELLGLFLNELGSRARDKLA